MNEEDWDELLNIIAKSLIGRAQAECGSEPSEIDIGDKLSSFLYASDETLNLSGDRFHAKEYLISYAKSRINEFI